MDVSFDGCGESGARHCPDDSAQPGTELCFRFGSERLLCPHCKAGFFRVRSCRRWIKEHEFRAADATVSKVSALAHRELVCLLLGVSRGFGHRGLRAGGFQVNNLKTTGGGDLYPINRAGETGPVDDRRESVLGNQELSSFVNARGWVGGSRCGKLSGSCAVTLGGPTALETKLLPTPVNRTEERHVEGSPVGTRCYLFYRCVHNGAHRRGEPRCRSGDVGDKPRQRGLLYPRDLRRRHTHKHIGIVKVS